MPLVTVQKVHPNIDGTMLEHDITIALLDADGLNLRVEQIEVSILDERSRTEPCWHRPLVRVEYAETEERTPEILQAATKAVCKAIGDMYKIEGLRFDLARGRIVTFKGSGEDAEIVKYVPTEAAA
jgi:hypothetical protein